MKIQNARTIVTCPGRNFVTVKQTGVPSGQPACRRLHVGLVTGLGPKKP
jgi:hypothetical protein